MESTSSAQAGPSLARASAEKLQTDSMTLTRGLATQREQLAQYEARAAREQAAAAGARELLSAVEARAADLEASLEAERRASGELRLRVAAAEKKPTRRSVAKGG